MNDPVVRARHVDWPHLLVIGLGGGFVVAGVSGWAGAAVAARVTGRPAPRFSIGDGVWAWCAGSDQEAVWGAVVGPPVVVYVVAAFTAGLLGLGVAAAAAVVRVSQSVRPTAPLETRPGIATRREVKAVASAAAIGKRAGSLRPSVSNPTAADVGYLHGRSHGIDVWSTVEDAVVVVGPTRSGKGLHVVVNAILDAPGAVVTTSTRPDNLTLTLRQREEVGPVAVFDPQDMVKGIPAGVKWSPVRGCRDPQTAMVRAKGFAGASGLGGGGVENGGFWQGQTESVIRCLLHAADLDGRDATDLYRWSIDPVAADREASAILESHPAAARGWATALQAAARADQRTRDSIWMGVRQAFASLADPRVLASVLPTRAEQFDPAHFLQHRGTVYLLGTATGAEVLGALISAFTEDLIETARRLAARQPGARLDPPLALVLDEIANFTGLPSLPALMSEGGGSGLTTFAVFQSLAQVRDKWGPHTANAIWDSAVVKIVLGGGSNTDDLRDLSALIGERDETTVSISTGGRSIFETSESASVRKVPVMDSAALRGLPFGTAVVMLRATRPLIVSLRPYTDRADASRLTSDQAGLEALIREHQ